MIIKNSKIGEHNTVMAEFGTGDIEMTVAQGEGYAAVVMKTCEPGPIGRYRPNRPPQYNTDDFKPQITMTFDKEASIDSLIRVLEDAKEFLP